MPRLTPILIFMTALAVPMIPAGASGRRPAEHPPKVEKTPAPSDPLKSTPLIEGGAGTEGPDNRVDDQGGSDRGSLPVSGHDGGAVSGTHGNTVGTAPADVSGTR
jgi:hypothetical protein